MEETAPVKVRKPRSDKGKSHGPRKASVPPPPILFAAEPEAPIFVRLRLKNYPEPVEFGCAEHTVENGFHVFMYPSERDRYRTTRREFAISEIIEVEITEARTSTWTSRQTETIQTYTGHAAEPVTIPSGPRIHSVKKNAASVLGQLESSDGPIKMAAMPNLSFGDSQG
jgi:hypothetical protein